jgi:hypothetical protein
VRAAAAEVRAAFRTTLIRLAQAWLGHDRAAMVEPAKRKQ